MPDLDGRVVDKGLNIGLHGRTALLSACQLQFEILFEQRLLYVSLNLQTDITIMTCQVLIVSVSRQFKPFLHSSNHVEKFAGPPHQIYIIAEGRATRCLSAEGEHNECSRRSQNELPQLCKRKPHHSILIDFDNQIAFLFIIERVPSMQVSTPELDRSLRESYLNAPSSGARTARRD